MSLWTQLLATYENIKDKPEANDLSDVDNFLLRDGLLVNNCDIEVLIDDNANFVEARLISKEESQTVMPATPESIGRTSGDAAHPLFDKLDYLANDWNLFIKDEKLLKKHTEKHLLYLENLGKWAEFSENKQLKILNKFFQNSNNFLSLLISKIEFPEFKDKEEIKESDYESLREYMVRFVVGSDLPNEMWKNLALYEEWSQNYNQILGIAETQSDISYLNGEIENFASYFPQKIRHQGDGAKLISSNDSTIVTFGGRFNPKNASEAAFVGQKSMLNALYALKWLIKKQAYSRDNMAVLSWSAGNISEVNAFNLDNPEVMIEFLKNAQENPNNDEFDATSNDVITAIEHFGQFSKNLQDLTTENRVNVVILDGETKGRVSICYYNEFDSKTYYQNLKRWFDKTQWLFNKDGKKGVRTPQFYQIYDVCYPKSKPDSKMKKQFLKQILPSVIEGRRLSRVLMQNAFRSVCARSAFTSDGAWWNGLCVACALINSYYNHGGKYMELDKEQTDRSYLFGRLLALAENIEFTATRAEQGNTSTNAERLFTQFTARPAKTWCVLERQLQPYYDKLYKQNKGGLVQYFKNLIKEILSKMSEQDFMSNKPVTEMFILGYYGQRNSYEKLENNTQGE